MRQYNYSDKEIKAREEQMQKNKTIHDRISELEDKVSDCVRARGVWEDIYLETDRDSDKKNCVENINMLTEKIKIYSVEVIELRGELNED